MNPQEALALIDNVLANNVTGTRADHVKLQSAVATLRAAIEPKEEDGGEPQ